MRAILTVLLLSLLLFCTTVIAADRPKGFLNIAWGASPEEAKRIMQAREGVKFPEETDDYHFELTGGKFAGQPVAKWVLEFPERKFASATVFLKNEGNAPALYKEIRTQLIAKYGTSTTDKKLGKAERRQPGGERPAPQGTQTSWKFVPNLSDKSAVTIVCEIAGANGQNTSDDAQLRLTIKYVNETMVAAATANMATGTKTGPAEIKKDEL
jgi:hypothetical protein